MTYYIRTCFMLCIQVFKVNIFFSIFFSSFLIFFFFSISAMIETALKTYSKTFEKILPILQKRSKASYISAAILLLVVKQVYSFLTPPKQLRAYPRISFFAVVKSFYQNESVFNRCKRLITPLMDSGYGFYIVS